MAVRILNSFDQCSDQRGAEWAKQGQVSTTGAFRRCVDVINHIAEARMLSHANLCPYISRAASS